MARQQLGAKKIAKLKASTGLSIVKVMVRGGTDHRQDLCLQDGTIVHRYPDGRLERSPHRWCQP